MRLFTGIEIPPALLDNMEALLQRLRPTARIQWSPIANLHITTKFIGNWPEEKLAELTQTLSAVPRTGSIRIGIGGLGFFPNPKSPRVLWAGVHASSALAMLAGETSRALAALNIAPEIRPYSPHLTLGRIKKAESLNALRDAMQNIDAINIGRFEATRFHLYLSKPGPSGSVYSRLATFPLDTSE
ncbi:MAG: RNA 2',3'-cyclic phosphodiesterase [Acidobacteriota bacterium]|nr:RNA 2',3'-cyclic phosphodiesterase [Acidobacteriota bacterium]